MTREHSYGDPPMRRRAVRAAGMIALLASIAAMALFANPLVGPELRAYIRDRFLRPWSRIPPGDG